MKTLVDITALAQEHYPLPEQERERTAFVEGFLTADPSRVIKNPQSERCKWGTRTGFFRSMEIGQTVQVSMSDASDWGLWRTTASHLHQVYGCKFSVVRDRKDRAILNITRYE